MSRAFGFNQIDSISVEILAQRLVLLGHYVSITSDGDMAVGRLGFTAWSDSATFMCT
jgi:hypothetical protein